MSGEINMSWLKARVAGIDISAASLSGLAAGFAYIAEMEADLRLLRHDTDDLRLLGGFVTKDQTAARRLGLLIHLANSVNLAFLYALAHDRLPGPPWLRGAIFANVENAVLYPLARFDRLHPAIQRGDLGRYWRWAAFLQSIPRHVVYGAVLGALYDRLRRA